MKTTERYIRANRLTQEVVFQRAHKLATKTRTATDEGSRKWLILLGGASGFEPPISRSRMKKDLKI